MQVLLSQCKAVIDGYSMLKKILLITSVYSSIVTAADVKVNGIIDVRASSTDSIESYLHGGYGKFSSNDGEDLSLAQLGVALTATWESGLSGHIVANSYADSEETEFGLTEAFLRYRTLPNESGYRFSTKAGIFYPDISLENKATAWASQHTLNSSSLNTWIGEEIRALGSEFKLTRLGKFNQANYDMNLTVSAFVNNDPTGALISWHGWVISQRQTLWTEKRKLPDFIANRPGNILEPQADSTDPFLEVDNRIGAHIKGDIVFHQKGELSLGYYNNNAQPYRQDNGQYAWRTKFYHAGVKWQLPYNIRLTAQYLKGDTLMQSPDRIDMVNNDYHSAYAMLSKRKNKHSGSVRVEEFSVTDNDATAGDNNNEYGKALTLNYTYRLSKPWFMSAEYIWINSDRFARTYTGQPESLIEEQIQLAARYFF